MDDTQEAFLIRCPKCGQISDSIKCCTCPTLMLFLGLLASMDTRKEICCPKCMRKELFDSFFNYNIITGNILWIASLPIFMCKYFYTYTKGHSTTVHRILAEEPDTFEAYENPLYEQL